MASSSEAAEAKAEDNCAVSVSITTSYDGANIEVISQTEPDVSPEGKHSAKCTVILRVRPGEQRASLATDEGQLRVNLYFANFAHFTVIASYSDAYTELEKVRLATVGAMAASSRVIFSLTSPMSLFCKDCTHAILFVPGVCERSSQQ